MRDSFFSEKRIRTIVIFAGAGILLILLIVTIILVFSPGKTVPVTETKTTSAEKSLSGSRFRVMDFYLDDEMRWFFQRQSYPMRDPSTVWDKQEVERYFIPVNEILHEYFQKRNDNYIKEMFSNIE